MPFLKSHVAAITFISTATLLALGLAAEDNYPVISVSVSTALFIILATYYGSYLYNYRKILNNSAQAAYLHNLYSIWGVFAFGFLAIFASALIADLLDSFWPQYFFKSAGIVQVLKLLFRLIVDALSFGVLSPLDIKYGDLEKGVGGTVFVFLVSAIIKSGLLAAIYNTIKEFNHSKRLADELFNPSKKKPDDTERLNKRVLDEFYRRYTREIIVSVEAEDKLLKHVINSNFNEARNIALLIAQRTDALSNFQKAVEYLVAQKDFRVAKLNRAALSTEFNAALENSIAKLPQRKVRKRRTNSSQ